jgi:hypothetical protein
MNFIRATLHVIWMILVPLVIANGIWYLLGAFIAQDWNPMHWWLFTSVWGRIIAVLIEVSVLANIPDFWEQFE